MNLSTLSLPSVSRIASPDRTQGQRSLRLSSKLALVAAVTLGLLPGAKLAEAAPIIWQTPQAVTGLATDVITQGTLFGAYQLVPDTYNPVASPIVSLVNGVNFYAVLPNSTYSNITTSGMTGGWGQFGSNTGAYAAIQNTGYKILLAYGNYTNTGSLSTPMQMTLSNLTPNTTYLVQIWANDSRGGGITRTETFESLGGSVSDPLTYRQSADGGLGQYIVGTFTTGASETTQSIFSTTALGQVNALQLRVIPEPSTYALIGLGIGFVLWAKRRRALQA